MVYHAPNASTVSRTYIQAALYNAVSPFHDRIVSIPFIPTCLHADVSLRCQAILVLSLVFVTGLYIYMANTRFSRIFR